MPILTLDTNAPTDVSRSAVFVSAENYLLVLLFVMSATLPFVEIILRSVFHVGIVGVATIVQHLILAVGMLGAAVAARENRLLTLAASNYIKGRKKEVAYFINRVISSFITVLLMLTAIDFTVAERQSGMELVYGLPIWVAELPLVIGYGLIALRLLNQAACVDDVEIHCSIARDCSRGAHESIHAGLFCVRVPGCSRLTGSDPVGRTDLRRDRGCNFAPDGFERDACSIRCGRPL